MPFFKPLASVKKLWCSICSASPLLITRQISLLRAKNRIGFCDSNSSFLGWSGLKLIESYLACENAVRNKQVANKVADLYVEVLATSELLMILCTKYTAASIGIINSADNGVMNCPDAVTRSLNKSMVSVDM